MDTHTIQTSEGQPKAGPGDFIVFKNQEGPVEMLKISEDGFWVRGVKVEQGPGEARAVYEAMKALLGVHVPPPQEDPEVTQG